MSELMNVPFSRKDFRRRLLTTASALALLASVYGGQPASASQDEKDRPVLWIELGGQLERLDGGQVPYAPPFFDTIVNGGFESPLKAGRANIYSTGIDGTVSFMPVNSDWVFSGSVRYGRSSGHKFLHQQKTQVIHFTLLGYPQTRTAFRYEQTKADNSEAHLIADFQAGKDVGLGMFGGKSTSTVSAGVRFAQFSAKSDIAVHAQPDAGFSSGTVIGLRLPFIHYHQYFGSAQRAANFRGVGPSISWNGSAPFAGNPQDGQIALDWGANVAILFGRQKARAHHQSSGSYLHHINGTFSAHPVPLPTHHGTPNRSRSVIVPNVGGFAGLSFRYADAKISLGYRGDFFFGAVDGGLDTRKSETRGFYGPFASVSVGIGD